MNTQIPCYAQESLILHGVSKVTIVLIRQHSLHVLLWHFCREGSQWPVKCMVSARQGRR